MDKPRFIKDIVAIPSRNVHAKMNEGMNESIMILNSSRKLLRNYDIELFFADIFAKVLQTYC